MGTNFSFISELKTIREQKSNLSEREAELTSPMLTDFSLISEIYSHFKTVLGNMEPEPFAESPTQRKKFIFIILCLYAPSALAGGKIPSGLRKAIADAIKLRDVTFISHNIDAVVFQCQNIKDYRSELTYLYNEVESYLRIKELIK